MNVAIGVSWMDDGDASFDSGARLDHTQPRIFICVLPEVGIAVGGRQGDGRASGIAEFGRDEEEE